MNIHHLELFVAVVDHGGFSSAAERLGIAQPAVSTAVRKLEQDLGARLLDRETRPPALTRAGAVFVHHARAILAQVASSRHDMVGLENSNGNRISVGAPPMVGAYLLPAVVDQFLTENPGVHLTVVQAGAEEIAGRVLRGELDLGIVADWQLAEGLDIKVLQRHPMVACVAPRSELSARQRLTWQELFDQPLILFPRGYHQRSRVEEAAARMGRTMRVVVEAESVPLIALLVRRGHGVATLLAAAAQKLPGIKALQLPTDATVPIAICRRAHAPASPDVAQFEKCLAENLAGRPIHR